MPLTQPQAAKQRRAGLRRVSPFTTRHQLAPVNQLSVPLSVVEILDEIQLLLARTTMRALIRVRARLGLLSHAIFIGGTGPAH